MRCLSLALLGLVVIGLSACGGGDGDGGEAAEIRAVVEASAVSTNPADCRRYGTMNLLEQSTKAQGQAAVRACEESKLEPHDLPTAVVVTRVEIDGNAATAQVASVDGAYSEQEPIIALVKEDGSWKEDEILGFAVFDREAFLLEFGREIMGRARTAAHLRANACALRQFERLSDSELEAVLLDSSQAAINDLVRVCEPRSQSA